MDSAKKQIDAVITTDDTVTVVSGPQAADALQISTIDLSSTGLNNTFDWSYTNIGVVAQPINTVLSVDTNSGGYSWNTMASAMTVGQSGKLQLEGKDADIVINGASLVDKLDAIAERLNMLEVNPELEAEWDQLRELGEQYRQLEQDLKAKSEMWKTLKTRPPNKLRS